MAGIEPLEQSTRTKITRAQIKNPAHERPVLVLRKPHLHIARDHLLGLHNILLEQRARLSRGEPAKRLAVLNQMPIAYGRQPGGAFILGQAQALVAFYQGKSRSVNSRFHNPIYMSSMRVGSKSKPQEKTMIGYTTIGTNDLDRAVAFFDALFEVLGASKMDFRPGRMVGWRADKGAILAVCVPHDEQKASVGNGVMIALNAGNKAMVQKLYDKAIALGAADEGEVGPRGDGSFFGGYFRDMDGNKFCAFCFEGV